MRKNPFSDNLETRTDVDTAKGRRLTEEDGSVPVLLMAYSPADDDNANGVAEDRWSLSSATTVGRKAPSNIAVPDSCMSKEHFRITSVNGSFFLEDVGSTNGTSLNGKSIGGRALYPLNNGALIRAGQSLFVFHEDGESLLRPPSAETFGIAGRFHAAPLIDRLRKMANARTNVLLAGPTGVGKELAAHALARLAGRKLVIHNAAKFGTEDEALSNLFGVSRGTFTGVDTRMGLIESADGGMLFLDEAHTLPRRAQKSLLRVAEEWFVSRIGEQVDRRVDVRLILASNDPSSTLGLEHDLLARLHVIELVPICERVADIPSIFRYVVKTMFHRDGLDSSPLWRALTADDYETLCLNGFEADNTRGLMKLCADMLCELKAAASPEQAVRTAFKRLSRKTPVSIKPREELAPSLTRADDLAAVKDCNMDLTTLNLIRDAYYKQSGVVVEMERQLKEQGLVLSRRRISKAVDALNLPRLKRNR